MYIQEWGVEFLERNPLDLGAVLDWAMINVQRDLCQENRGHHRTNDVQRDGKNYAIDDATTKMGTIECTTEMLTIVPD